MTTLKPLTMDQTSVQAATSHAAQSATPSPVKNKAKQESQTSEVFSRSADARSSETASRLSDLRNDVETRTAQARVIKTATEVNTQIEAMKDALTEIKKNYPPFLRGDDKRQQLLMTFSEIRKQIEAMMVPPDYAGEPTVNQPAQVDVKKLWADMFNGVTIPQLTPSGPSEASDAEIQVAYESLSSQQLTIKNNSLEFSMQSVSRTQISDTVAETVSFEASLKLSKTGYSLSYSLKGELQNL